MQRLGTFEIKTMTKKAIYETIRFLGGNLGLTELDAAFWRRNYSSFENLTNPFEVYQFTNATGEIQTYSLADLCLFQEGTFQTARREAIAILEEISSGPSAIVGMENFTGSLPASTPPNFRSLDPRFNNPGNFFSFPHRTDVYTPSITVYPGVPIPKVSRFVGYKPTQNIFNRSVFGDEAYWQLVNRILSCLNQYCYSSNIHPGVFSAMFTSRSPVLATNDYNQTDRIAAEIIRNNRSDLEDAGVILDINNPRYFWAHTFDGDQRDVAVYARTLSDATGISLESNANSYFCRFAFPHALPDCNENGNTAAIRSIRGSGSFEAVVIERSISTRAPYVANSQGVRCYGDSVTSMLQLVNLLKFVVDHPPQLFLHSGMSFHNALLKMALAQCGSNINTVRNYENTWNIEVQARAQLPAGESGYNVPLHSDITPENIGTLGIAAGTRVGQGNQAVGAAIIAISALIREMESPAYGQVLARAPELEFVRQDGSHTLGSTVYRGFSARKILTCQPVLRLP